MPTSEKPPPDAPPAAAPTIIATDADPAEAAAANEPEGESLEHAPDLKEDEQKLVAERSAVRVHVVHEAIRREGEEELSRPVAALAWSGLAAGLSMGFSLVTEGLLRAHLPDAAWRPLVTKWGYSVGFLIVVLARQQLFTENTLTGIIPLLARRDRATLGKVARVWAVVFAANLLGALCFALVAARTDAFPPEMKRAFGELALETWGAPFATVVLRAVFAGWLIALMVWMQPATQSGRVFVVMLVTYIVALGGFTHIIAGSIDTLFLVASSILSPSDYLLRWMAPTLLGNVIGGVSLAAALNHAQVMAGNDHGARNAEKAERDPSARLWHPGRVRASDGAEP